MSSVGRWEGPGIATGTRMIGEASRRYRGLISDTSRSHAFVNKSSFVYVFCRALGRSLGRH
jgi:hypothetical protein